jgi:hypothetical protein
MTASLRSVERMNAVRRAETESDRRLEQALHWRGVSGEPKPGPSAASRPKVAPLANVRPVIDLIAGWDGPLHQYVIRVGLRGLFAHRLARDLTLESNETGSRFSLSRPILIVVLTACAADTKEGLLFWCRCSVSWVSAYVAATWPIKQTDSVFWDRGWFASRDDRRKLPEKWSGRPVRTMLAKARFVHFRLWRSPECVGGRRDPPMAARRDTVSDAVWDLWYLGVALHGGSRGTAGWGLGAR